MTEQHEQAIAQRGFTLLRSVFPRSDTEVIKHELEELWRRLPENDASIRSRGGRVYAVRNLLSLYPAAADLWRRGALVELLGAVLGDSAGLVRGLYFDKPPERSWSLPWHKDMTIAVRDNRLPSEAFEHPTCKAGVPHVEAPEDVLRKMLTLRIHLDDVSEENGPLRVSPGSHLSGKQMREKTEPPEIIHAHAGDVLAMRPLLSHCSGNSQAGARRHRRIVHLEFAGSERLPDGYRWRDFIR